MEENHNSTVLSCLLQSVKVQARIAADFVCAFFTCRFTENVVIRMVTCYSAHSVDIFDAYSLLFACNCATFFLTRDTSSIVTLYCFFTSYLFSDGVVHQQEAALGPYEWAMQRKWQEVSHCCGLTGATVPQSCVMACDIHNQNINAFYMIQDCSEGYR